MISSREVRAAVRQLLAQKKHVKLMLKTDQPAEQIDAMDDGEIVKLYGRFEARLSAAMTKTLGQAALQVYSGLDSTFLPIPPENRPKLVADLEADLFVEHPLCSATCELYHHYGMYLAPLTAALTTAKYCQYRHTSPRTTASHETQEIAETESLCDCGTSRESYLDSGGAAGTADDT